jgi:peptide/nickel transport system permease protein
VTLSLVAVSIVLTAVVGVVLGVASARRGGWVDRVTQVISVVGFALPSYWLALVLVLTIALPMPWLFPATGYVPPTVSVSAWLLSIALPCIALTIGGVATIAQQVRGSMIDTMRLDFVRTLRSRGIAERNIVYRHALRSSAGPALTVLSLQFIGMLGGAIIIERVFALPGIGSLAATASLRGDIPVVMGVVTFSVLVVVVVNLLVDITQGILNPKVRTA